MAVWAKAPVMAVVNMVACFAFASLSVFIAGRNGKNRWIAGAIALLAPVSWWTGYAGVDTTAAALLLLAYVCHESGHTTEAVFVAITACLVHLLIVPIMFVYVLFRTARKEPTAAVLILLLTFPVGLALLLTPYGGLVTASPGGIGVPGMMGLVFLGGPFVLGYAFLRSSRVAILGRSSGPDALAIPFAICVVGGALACAMQRHFQVRYGLPALGFGAGFLAPRVGWVSGHLRAPQRKGEYVHAESA